VLVPFAPISVFAALEEVSPGRVRTGLAQASLTCAAQVNLERAHRAWSLLCSGLGSHGVRFELELVLVVEAGGRVLFQMSSSFAGVYGCIGGFWQILKKRSVKWKLTVLPEKTATPVSSDVERQVPRPRHRPVGAELDERARSPRADEALLGFFVSVCAC
jgi:hypothetical protein